MTTDQVHGRWMLPDILEKCQSPVAVLNRQRLVLFHHAYLSTFSFRLFDLQRPQPGGEQRPIADWQWQLSLPVCK
jgi:hypothetical protein